MESSTEELMRWAGFTLADGELVASLESYATPHFLRIATELYDRLSEHEAASRVLEGDEHGRRLKASLVDWLARLFGGPYDDRHFESAKTLGRLLMKVGLPSRYVSAVMSSLRSALMAVVAPHAKTPEEAVRSLDALSRLLDVHLALMLDSYHEQLASRVRSEQDHRLSALGTLSAGLAHEIRNPLNGARLHVSLLQRELKGRASPDAMEAIRVIDGEIDRLARLLSDFLDYAERQPLARGPLSASNLLARCAALVEPLAAARSVVVEVDSPPGDVTFDADGPRLEKVVVNLLTNAIEAMSPKGTARARVCRESAGVRIEVEDDGPGTPEGAPVFDPFFTTKQDGTGLGLSVAHRIVTDHGGTIDVDSRPGRTIFRVQIPNPRRGQRET